MRYKRKGCTVMRQSTCLVVNPIAINNFVVLFNCMPVGRDSDSMIAQYKANYLVCCGWTLVCFLAHRGPTSGLLLLLGFGSLVILDVVFRYL